MRKVHRSTAIAAVAATGALLLAACGGSSDGGGSASPTQEGGTAGGTIYILSPAEQILTLDPQVVYTGEDLAFLGATIQRSLTAYKLSPNNDEGTSLVPDMATDTGRPNADATEWQFTLRDGITWENGNPVTCEDVKTGVGRQFDIGLAQGGPVYGVTYLDVPSVDGFSKNEETGKGEATSASAYAGPYKDNLDIFKDEALKTPIANDKAAFDKAVNCSSDGKTITFKLNQPVPDFNYTVTLGFSAVPADIVAGEDYANKPLSNGPYKIQEYKKGKGGKLVLVRNDKWNKDSDPYRSALPDQWQVDFGVEETVVDERVIADSGNDQTAITQGLTTASLALVFDDPALESRRIDAFDPYSLYAAINVEKVPDVKCRQAIAVALDREALLKNAGGKFAGEYADGVIKPNIGIDYAPTKLWDGLLGQAVPPTGDPEFAKKLLGECGKPSLTVTLDYAQSEDSDKAAAIWVESLKRAGITVKPNPIERGQYYGVVFQNPNEIMTGGWGPDWPNASTVIPPLFVQGWNLSRVADEAFNEKVKAASVELDRNKQATMWQELNAEAAKNMWVVPTRFGRDQRIAGSKVGPVYSWPAYGSWPYAAMYVKQ